MSNIQAALGLSQLKRLNENNKKRILNFNIFLKNLDKNKYFINFQVDGSCNYAFPVILKTTNLKKRNYFEKKLKLKNIEFRRGNAGGGNQLRQPYLKSFLKVKNFKNFKNVEHIHSFGYYLGNFPDLKPKKIITLTKFLNSLEV